MSQYPDCVQCLKVGSALDRRAENVLTLCNHYQMGNSSTGTCGMEKEAKY